MMDDKLIRLLRVGLVSCLLLVAPIMLAQPKAVKKKIEAIQENPVYKYGFSKGSTFDEAYKAALEKLVESIYVFVTSSIEQSSSHVVEQGEERQNEQLYSNLSTFSIGTLQDVGRIEYGEEPEVGVFVYVTEHSVKQMFDARLNKVKSLIYNGIRDEERFRVGDALRYYTWSLCLLQTLPMGDAAVFEYQGRKEIAKLWLHARINSLLADSRITVQRIESVDEPGVKKRVHLQLSYKDQLMDSFAFSFYNGMRNIGPIFVSDGRAVAEFSEEELDIDELEVKIEYLFKSQAQSLDKELALVMDNVDLPKFSAALKHVPLEKAPKVEVMQASLQQTNKPVNETNGLISDNDGMTLQGLETNRVQLAEVSDPQPYAEIMGQIVSAIRSKKYGTLRPLFTEVGYEMFDALINNGNVSLLDVPKEYQMVQYGATVICRKLPMQFKFRNNHQFVNDVVFRFNANTRQIESIAFALSRRSENDILTADKKWKGNWRMDIISFLEDYQTAYALRRLDYLESVFSDDALIVSGVVLQRKPGSVAGEGYYEIPGSTADEVRYTKYSKQQYMERLRYCFNSKEYINLRFNETEVIKGSGTRDGIFAMQLSQDYYSSNYGDTGYLTLLVDLREELPVIKVRVWQQQKDPEFTARTLLNY